MRVLWFTNSPVSAKEKINSNFVGEGWIGALEKIIVEHTEIELAIAFPSNVNSTESYEIEHVKYYAVPRRTGNKKRRIGFGNTYRIDDHRAVEDYIEVISEYKPDIIQVFGSESNFGLIIEHIQIPVVIHIQGNINVVNLKYFSSITKLDVLLYTHWKNFLRGSNLLTYFKYLKKTAEREKVIFRNCKYFIGRTKWDKNITRVLASKAKYYHCDEVLRPEFYLRKWKIKGENKLTLLSVIRGTIYKGLDTVLEAALLLKELNVEFEWLIVGNSEHDQIPKLLERKYKVSFSKVNIKFLGNKNAGQIVNLLSDSSIYIHPSHIENSPNAICEAMIMGVPVIATAVGGTSSIVKENDEGILIQDGDPYVMAGAVLELKDNKLLKNNLSINARKRALKRHDPSKVVKELSQIYTDIVQDYYSKKEPKKL